MNLPAESGLPPGWLELGRTLHALMTSPAVRTVGTIEPLALRPVDAARAVGLSRAEVFKLLQAGELPSFKVGTARLILVEDLKAWLERQRDEAETLSPALAVVNGRAGRRR